MPSLLVTVLFKGRSQEDAPTYDFDKISKKTHEIRQILGRGAPEGPLRSPTALLDWMLSFPVFDVMYYLTPG